MGWKGLEALLRHSNFAEGVGGCNHEENRVFTSAVKS